VINLGMCALLTATGAHATHVLLQGKLALRLLQRLLHWEPSGRPSARQALQHAFFTGSSEAACSAVELGQPGWC
jgi:hypothetical protein